MSTSTSSSSSSSAFYSTQAVSVSSGISSKDGQLKSGKKTFSIRDYIPAASQSSSSGRSQMADCCASSPSQQAQTAAKANVCFICNKEFQGNGRVKVGNTVFFFCNEQHKKTFIAHYNANKAKQKAMQKLTAPADSSKAEEPKVSISKLVIREDHFAEKDNSWGVIGKVAQFVANCVSSVVASTKGNESMIF